MTLSDFLRLFMEYAGDEHNVKSFPQPNARAWHIFLWNVRCVFHSEGLPHDYFGGFSFNDKEKMPESNEFMNALEQLSVLCHTRHPDWRLMLYPKAYRRELCSLSRIEDQNRMRSIEVAFAFAMRTDDFFEL
ncbi:MAG: hypothetical protein KGI50_02760 [Patescibacteria group bacterium]|nr:hypothetical protein [Patescibacteria group bacterium]MDE2438567.1 hypothetical protein [Patescibacteria group bacterium]